MTDLEAPVQVGTRMFPSGTMATGWYQIGWSSEFGPGQPVSLRYFDRQLVVFRGPSGGLRALDAFCPHMGADLAGGRVVGDEIECPFHGWRWSGADGANTCVPYGSKDRLNVAVQSWPVREIDGIALVWFSPARLAPWFEPPRFNRSDDATEAPFPTATATWRNVAMVPQVAAENVPDAAHFQYVHRSPSPPTLDAFESTDAMFRANWSIVFGDGRGPSWATPCGPLPGRIVTEAWGVGLGWNTQFGFDEVASLAAYTPIDARTVDVRLTVWVTGERADGTRVDADLRRRWFEFQRGQIEGDINVWSRQTYIQRPLWADTEVEAMRAIRHWTRRFYEPPAAREPSVAQQAR